MWADRITGSARTERLISSGMATSHPTWSSDMTLIDLSHVIEQGMITYPGLPGPEIGEHLSFAASSALYAAGTEFTIGTITMVSNTGTYLDTPGHRHRGRHDLAGLPLELLLRTGWDRHWRTARYGHTDHPYLTADGAQHLVERGAVLVGIDAVNIDDTAGGERPAHTILLRADVLIVEHLTGLDRLPAGGARFTAVPPAVAGMSTFPVRAYAVVP
jgi:arylformamidase